MASEKGPGRTAGQRGGGPPPAFELAGDGKYDVAGRRREPDPAAWAVPITRTDCVPGSADLSAGERRNRLILGDNRAVMSALLTELRGQIDLIYIDPPFNLGADVTLSVPLGERSDNGELEILAYRDQWGRGADSYEQMMYERLALMRGLLRETGSLYVHCDYRMNAVLRLILDELFGADRLCNEIIWHYQSGGRQRNRFSMKHDTLFLYTRSDRWTFNLEAIGRPRGTAKRNHMKRQVAADGRTCFTIKSAGRVYTYYEDDVLTPPDVWTDISHIQQKDPQRSGYPTQKPEALLERVIRASSNEGDLVADFFCGSGTTGVVAERLGRRWILCDDSRPAVLDSMKRLIETQRELRAAGRPAAGFDVFATENLGSSGGEDLFAEIVQRDGRSLDVRLTGYKPQLDAWPCGVQPRIGQQTASANLELIEFWAVDFDWRLDRPFRQHWQAFRTRRRRTLTLESHVGIEIPDDPDGFICVKAFDSLGRESRAIIRRPDSRSMADSSRRTDRE